MNVVDLAAATNSVVFQDKGVTPNLVFILSEGFHSFREDFSLLATSFCEVELSDDRVDFTENEDEEETFFVVASSILSKNLSSASTISHGLAIDLLIPFYSTVYKALLP